MVNTIRSKGLVACFMMLFSVSGCVSPNTTNADKNSSLTQGNVQLNLKVGETNKTQVLETFGAPNITTRDGAGREVWSYQRAAQVQEKKEQAGYWSIILAGGGRSNSGFETSSSMITLIIKFDANDVVQDFRSRTSHF